MERAKLNTAPFASVFLALVPFAIALQVPTGEPVRIAISDCSPPRGDGDRNVLVRIRDDGKVEISGEKLSYAELDNRLRIIYARRAEKLLFLSATPGLPFQEVANVIGLVKHRVDTVAILTPTVQARRCWVIPEHGLFAWSTTGQTPETLRGRDPAILTRPRLEPVPLTPW